MNANAQVHLYNLQVARETFSTINTKDTFIYILHLFNWLFLAFLMTENNVIHTVTLHHLSQFWCVIMLEKNYFLIRKKYFPKGKYHFYSPQKLQMASEM